jgi:hypothetical protein
MSEHLLYLSRGDVRALAIQPGEAREAAVMAWKPCPGPSVSALFGRLRFRPAA